MEAKLEQIWQDGRAAWPAIEITREQFHAHTAGRVELSDDSRIAAEDLYLACGCALGIAAAIEGFEDRYAHHITAILGRFGIDRDLMDEAGQATRTRLLVGPRPAIASYRGRGSLLAFLRVTTVRVALDTIAREERHRPAEDELELVAPVDDLEMQYLKAVYREEFRAAFAAALESLPGQDRSLLRYQLVDGRSIDELGQMFGIHRATAARRLARIRSEVARATYRTLADRLQLDRAQLESLVRLVQSNVELSVSRLLRDSAHDG